MSLFDHLFFLFIIVVQPVAGYISFQRLLGRFWAGKAIDRIQLYRFTTVAQWIGFLAALSIWGANERPWAQLGFSLQTGIGFFAGATLTAAGIAFLSMQLRHAKNASESEAREFLCQIGQLKIILPHNRSELGRLYGLSLTAGIVEETLWRGFIIWYLAQFMPLWAAGVLSAVGFGLAHAYQGTAKIPRIVLVGGIFVGIYLLSGSLWLPMLLHALVDMLQGRLAFEIITRANTDATPQRDEHSDAIPGRAGCR